MKKWFIYVTDHHEGPFTVEEIQQGISEGKFSAQGFIWAQGMSDWLPMSSVPEFNTAPPQPEAPTSPSMTSVNASSNDPIPDLTSGTYTHGFSPAGGGHVETSPTLTGISRVDVEDQTSQSQPVAEPVPEEKTLTTIVEVNEVGKDTSGNAVFDNRSTGYTKEIRLEGDAPVNPTGGIKSAGAFSGPAPAEKKFSVLKPIIFVVAIVAILLGLSRAGLLRPIEEKISGAFISIPELPDVGPDEHAQLVAAAKTPLSQGPAVAVAVSRADPLSPSFYVASNMPEGTRFELYIEGVPSTLLNTLEYSGKTEVQLSKNLGKTPPYRSADGRVVPRGEYRIFVVESLQGQSPRVIEELKRLTPVSRTLPSNVPSDRSIVFEKTVFLGQKDATYTTRLKEFHDRLGQKARSELMELKQFVQLIENQFATTQATFERLKRQPLGKAQIRAWKQMDSNWLRLDDQLSQSLAKLTPETMKTDYIYGDVYALVKEAQKRLNEMHAFQGSYFDKAASLAEAEEQVSQLLPQYEAALGRLKDTLALIDQSPLDANGLPKKVVIPPATGAAS